ncbi:MAG TPA: 1,4-alpha-glucan branching protein GlgB [Candidatus Limnocylindria bacterium]|nr:1,4-alpha-glucan branching protein GlgB [Candidatus Limnocylindria bacterium]
MRYLAPGEAQRHDFHQGQSRDAYRTFGAHPVFQDEDCWHFTVWAPNARAVSLTGEFCFWDYEKYPMKKQHDGTWELRLPDRLFTPAADPKRFSYEGAAQRLRAYKYAVLGADGEWRLKADPFSFAGELRPNTASLLCDLDGYEWGDTEWMRARAAWKPYDQPVNIYEMHLGSWRRGEDGRMLGYGEIADQLIPYIDEMGYTHVELLPVMEHPLDMSWGYQVTGYYAATARHGTPREFMAFVDRLHQAGIGVILDWVPAHFPRDEVGLRRFDGTPCYEHEDLRRAEMPQWGTMMFDMARGEVNSFLLSNACFWLEVFHADGLRCDAVSSMLFHDFGRGNDYLPNKYGGRENLEAIEFLRKLNRTVYRDFPGAMMIAEESTAFPLVTRPLELGGLGFGFKWNMGWMNDILSYIALDPLYRKGSHEKITFSMMYAFSENYILPFSHDEVVHGKKSMLDKQPGDLWQKFAGVRALYGYQMAHPGKKLLFMGGEFGQFIEWNYDGQLDWFLMVYERHPDLCRFVRELNRFYRDTPALFEADDSWDGFQWLAADDRDRSIAAFTRTGKAGDPIVCMVNFTPAYYPAYRVGLPGPGEIEECLNSDRREYGGSDKGNPAPIKAEKIPCNGLPWSLEVCVPPLSAVYFRYRREPEPASGPPEDAIGKDTAAAPPPPSKAPRAPRRTHPTDRKEQAP